MLKHLTLRLKLGQLGLKRYIHHVTIISYLTFIQKYCGFVFPGTFGMNLYTIVSLKLDGIFVVSRALLEPRSGIQTVIGNILFGVATQ